MKPIRIFRHVDCEGPGYLTQVLKQHNLPYELIKIDQGEKVPPGIDDVSGLVFMGGSMSANDDLPWIEQEMQLIREAIARDLPVLGHCLGGQLISKALGGKITANPVKEIGWLDVQSEPCDLATEWMPNLTEPFEAFHWHGETFSIPEGATLILTSQHCRHQAFVIGNSLAMQCHIEMTRELVEEWATRFSDQLMNESVTVQSKDEMIKGLEARVWKLQQAADVIYARWLRPIIESG